MESKILKNIEIPLEIRVEVAIQAHFIKENGGSMLVPLDKDGNDILEVTQINSKCLEMAQPIIDVVLEEIKEWKKEKGIKEK
jgi:hypothetical protein